MTNLEDRTTFMNVKEQNQKQAVQLIRTLLKTCSGMEFREVQ